MSSEENVVADRFTFEHRDSKGRLIATNKKLKTTESIKVFLRRLLRRLARV